jgi:hypothetical protein
MNEPYIQALQDAIQHMHGCASRHIETVNVREMFQGQTAWDGSVEVFDLIGHPTAHQCYAWAYQNDTSDWQYVAVLKVPPVNDAHEAVQAYMVSRRPL